MANKEFKQGQRIYFDLGTDKPKGWSTCRICHKMNGTTCLTDGEFVYPEGYSHYIRDHNIMPDLDLLAKVLSQ